MASGSGDGVYTSVPCVKRSICTAFKPDLILYQAGVDGLEADALGKLNVSRDGMRQRNHLVFEAARDVPLVVFMGGGYASSSMHRWMRFSICSATPPRGIKPIEGAQIKVLNIAAISALAVRTDLVASAAMKPWPSVVNSLYSVLTPASASRSA